MRSCPSLIAVLLLSLLLNACGGGSSSGRSGTAVVTPPANDPPPSEPPPPAEPPPIEPVPYEPPGPDDYEMPPLEQVLAPETDFELACASTPEPGDAVPAPPVSGDTGGASNGVLVDSTVSGVAYQTAGIEGVTDASGHFHFQAGESVRFALGDTLLGEVTGMAQVTPFDLAGSSVPVGMAAITRALEDEEHAFHTVINTAVLLQSLDEDGKPGNGIAITPETAALMNGVSLDTGKQVEDFSEQYLLALVLGAANSQGLFSVPHGAVNPARAVAHLYSTLGVEAHTFGISLEQADWDGDGIPNDMTRYRYDTDGHLVEIAYSHEDGRQGTVESWRYDGRGKLTGYETREVGEQSAESWVYLENGELWKHERDRDDNGIIDETETWSYQYRQDGRLRKATMVSHVDHESEPLSAVVTFAYNSSGNPARIEFTGDRLDQAVAQLDLPSVGYLEYGTSYVISYEYGASGNLVADTLDGQNPELGYHIVTRQFDNRGNIIYSKGRFMQGTDNEEQVTVSEYQYEYDGRGNIVERREDENGDGEYDQIHAYTYTVEGNISREENDWDGDGDIDEIARYEYDQHGAIVRIEWDNDADGSIDNIDLRPYEYEYDGSGRITRRSLERNGEAVEVIGYAWHPDGTLAQEDTWIRDVAVTNTSSWQYDSQGKLLRKREDHGGDGLADRVTRYGYDACGGLVSREIFNGNNEQRRSSAENWTYDAAGMLRYHEWVGMDLFPTLPGNPLPPGVPIFASEGFQRWQYAADGRHTRYRFECNGECFVFGDGWDFTAVPIPDQVINWEYDDAGRLTRELVDENGDGDAERVTVHAYDAAGNVIRTLVDTSASGAPNEATFYHYDSSDHLLRRDVDSNGDGVIDAVYITEFDAYGNVLSRFSDHDNDGAPEEHSIFLQQYDANGNRTRREADWNNDGVVDQIDLWRYDSSGNLASHEFDEDGNGVIEQATTYEYDADGNLLRESKGYSFDGDGVMEETESWEYAPTGWGHLFNNVEE